MTLSSDLDNREMERYRDWTGECDEGLAVLANLWYCRGHLQGHCGANGAEGTFVEWQLGTRNLNIGATP